MNRLELAAIRLYKATQADRTRTRKMNRFLCEPMSNPEIDQGDPCWKARYEDGDIKEGRTFTSEAPTGGHWTFAGGPRVSDWCNPCQVRQKLYADKSVRKELGNAKRSFWAATKALIKACEV